jgi:hypothetical protein
MGRALKVGEQEMEDAMRNALLTTVATIGLFAGANIVAAQTPAEPRKDQPAMSQEQKAPRAGAEEKSEDKSKATQEKSRPSSEKAAQETAKPADTKAKAAEGRAPEEKTKPASEKAAQEETKPSENKAKAAEGRAAEEKKPAGEKAAQDARSPENKGKGAEGKSADDKTKPAGEKAAQEQGKPTDNKSKTADDKAPSEKTRPVDRADTAKPNDNKAAQGKEGNSDKAADAKSGAAASVAPEKQAKISEVLGKEKAEPVTNVNFTISVGVSVPESVHVRRLPDEIVTIVPEYRGYDYVVIEEEIVIIEPRTRKIVVTIPRHGSRSASVSTTSTRIDLAPEKRKVIREIVMRERVKPVDDQIEITVGSEIPRNVEVHKFSEAIYSDVPELRSYEYFVRSNDVVLVRDRKIVEVIN